MREKNKSSNKSTLMKMGCLLYVFMMLPICACGLWFFRDSIPVPDSLAYLMPPTPLPTPTPTPEPGKAARELLFTGKVVNGDATNWPNERLVVLYLNGQEVGRTTTDVGANNLSEEGMTDGYFAIEIPNTYEIPENRFDFTEFEVKTDRSVLPSRQTIWFGNMIEGGLYEIPVPVKNLSYFIKIFATNTAYLPTEMLEEGSTRLTADREVVLALDWDEAETSSDNRILIQGVQTDVSQETVEINREIFSIENCQGNSVLSQVTSSTQTFYHEYETETTATASVDLPIKLPVLLELEARYGFVQGQINSKEVSFNMEAQPGTNVTYTLIWLETWESGVAIVEVESERLEVPFRVRKSVTSDISSEASACG
ncbi:MAG: hypothetical protein H6660_05630 [Ardenticatenaceae bacterium]|nr:hypothetical protein [Ardenticatenaceae bacterium]